MQTKKILTCAAVLMALVVAPGHAQVADAVSGVWQVTAAVSTRRERDGSLTVLREAELTLTLHRHGDSVSGVWAAKDAGPVGMDHDVAGRISGNVVTFETQPFQRTITVNGEEQEVVMTIHWRAELEDGRLAGTRWLAWSGQSLMTPWKGEKQ